MTLAGITFPCLRIKQTVKVCRIRINLHDKNELFMKPTVNIKQQALCAHFIHDFYTSVYGNYENITNFKCSTESL
jgi:hypothetical protein